MNRQQKQELIDYLHKNFSESQATFFVNYQGLSVSQMQKLRTGLREKNSSLKVAKMRLVKRALDGISTQKDLAPFCKKQLGVVFASAEPTSVAKVLYDFSKENQSLELVAGALDANFLDSRAIMQIAQLPSREILLAQLMGTLNAPLNRYVFILRMLIQRLLFALKEIEKKK